MVDQTTHPPKCHSFVGLDRQIGSSPPANVKRFPANVKRFESKKFYICSDVTHTHTDACTQSSFDTQTLLHREAVTLTQSNFYTARLLHRGAFAQRSFSTQTLLHIEAFYTQKLLRTEVFTRKLYTEKLLHREASKQSIFNTQKHLYTHTQALHTRLCTQSCYT